MLQNHHVSSSWSKYSSCFPMICFHFSNFHAFSNLFFGMCFYQCIGFRDNFHGKIRGLLWVWSPPKLPQVALLAKVTEARTPENLVELVQEHLGGRNGGKSLFVLWIMVFLPWLLVFLPWIMVGLAWKQMVYKGKSMKIKRHSHNHSSSQRKTMETSIFCSMIVHGEIKPWMT